MDTRHTRLTCRAKDQGSITLEIVIAFPLVMLAILITINAALYYYARSVALSAAQEGVRAARTYRANHDAGPNTALTFARTVGNGFLLDPTTDPTGSNSTIIVIRVRGNAISLIPGLHLRVDRIARGTVERFTRPRNP